MKNTNTSLKTVKPSTAWDTNKFEVANENYFSRKWEGFQFPVYTMKITFDLAKWQDIDDPERYYRSAEFLKKSNDSTTYGTFTKNLRDLVFVESSMGAKGMVLTFRGTDQMMSAIIDAFCQSSFLITNCETNLSADFCNDDPKTESGAFRQSLRRYSDFGAENDAFGWW